MKKKQNKNAFPSFKAIKFIKICILQQITTARTCLY